MKSKASCKNSQKKYRKNKQLKTLLFSEVYKIFKIFLFFIFCTYFFKWLIVCFKCLTSNLTLKSASLHISRTSYFAASLTIENWKFSERNVDDRKFFFFVPTFACAQTLWCFLQGKTIFHVSMSKPMCIWIWGQRPMENVLTAFCG